MAITFSCECGKSVQVGAEYAGMDGQCPNCGRTVRIPGVAGPYTGREPTHLPPAPERSTPPPLPADVGEPEFGPDPTYLLTHAGVAVEEDDDFFVDAPPEIGAVTSVATSLKKHQDPMPLGHRLALAGGLFALGFAIAFFAILFLMGPGHWGVEQVLMLFLIPSALGGGLVVGAFWWTRFQHTCSYVGADGIACYQCTGDRDQSVCTGFFLFRDAVDLRIAQTRHYYNGGYTGTSYAFTWSDERGNTVYAYTGRYSSEAGTPVFTDPYYFLLAAETSWSLYLLRNIDRVTTSDELLFFGLTGGNHIQLGQGLFILTQAGKTIELRAAEIDKMTIANGMISVWEHGAKEGWFANQGIHQFLYSDVANARFFMFALDKLLGIRF